MCTSVTGAFTTIGVSTSSTPRAAKKCACAREQRGAQLEHLAREAVGRQSGVRRRPAPAIMDEARARRGSVRPARARPAAAPGSHSAAPGGSSRMTVEPMLNRPSSAPRSSRSGAPPGIERQLSARRGLHGVTSPCQTVAMLPTKSAPTSTSAKASGPSSKAQTTRSLRAKSPGTAAAVTALTLKSFPGTNHAARSVPAAACECGDSCRGRDTASRTSRRRSAALHRRRRRRAAPRPNSRGPWPAACAVRRAARSDSRCHRRARRARAGPGRWDALRAAGCA